MKINKFLISFVILCILSWISFILIYEKPEALRPSEGFRNIYNSIWLLVVAVVGYWGLHSKSINVLLLRCWIFVYTAIFGSLILLFLYSLFFNAFSSCFKSIIGNIRLFFTSPLPLMLFLILSKLPDTNQKSESG